MRNESNIWKYWSLAILITLIHIRMDEFRLKNFRICFNIYQIEKCFCKSRTTMSGLIQQDFKSSRTPIFRCETFWRIYIKIYNSFSIHQRMISTRSPITIIPFNKFPKNLTRFFTHPFLYIRQSKNESKKFEISLISNLENRRYIKRNRHFYDDQTGCQCRSPLHG